MHIVFLCHYFPPEVNAPASRTCENARHWVKQGNQVTVITCVPNHPGGRVYPGYKNRFWQWDEKDGIRVLRVKTFIGPNKGVVKRIANYVSYMISAALLCHLVKKADVVISTSPQFFCGLAGYFVSRRLKCPWMLEIRDLWPESIIAVGAIRQRHIIRLLEGIESFMYKNADHIICLTHAFKRHIMKRGIAEERLSIITNGADLDQFSPIPESKNQVKKQYGLDNKFVVSFIGTHGMAHGLDTVLEAAERLKDEKNILFLLVGDGAERQRLVQEKGKRGLGNILMVGQQEKRLMPHFISASDACMVLLRKSELFKTVIPSKIFEAMAMERPIIHGVEGESKEIIEAGKCGLCIEPENDEQLADAVLELYNNREVCRQLAENGKSYVKAKFNRRDLADKYLRGIYEVAGREM
ncbi:MAG: glycosyltransferase WbuB [Deltaproteobacteria bacterium]|nr:MAG: glycosyltransferase WbuB [Deltaproteobacteria bacterium]